MPDGLIRNLSRARRKGGVQRKIELACEQLSHLQRDLLQGVSVVLLHEERRYRAAYRPGRRICDKPLHTLAGRDIAPASTVRVGLLGYKQYYGPGITRSIANLREASNLPLAPDLESYHGRIPVTNIRKRYDGYLSTRLGANIESHTVDERDVC